MATPGSEVGSKTETRQGIVRWAGQMIGAWVVFGAILFLSAGRLDWAVGWAYLGLNALTQVLSAWVLIPRRADMLAERTRVGAGTKGWDRILAPAIAIVGSLAVIVTAGLDVRFGWSAPLGIGLWALGFAIAFGSQIFVLWAMGSNPYFATTVRIQDDRGHSIIRSGPYRLVRHPGYLGSIIYNLAIPLAMDSLWAGIPALLTTLLLVLRTQLEDRTLQAELPGHREYSAEVSSRLIPGIW